MEDFRRLRVYDEACVLRRELWPWIIRMPLHFQRTLGAQVDDAVESIGSNIAEGCGRRNPLHSNAELIRYAHFSGGSAFEADHRIAGLYERSLIPEQEYRALDERVQRIKRMLNAWIRELIRRDRGRQD
jgi:four helix bundle protein